MGGTPADFGKIITVSGSRQAQVAIELSNADLLFSTGATAIGNLGGTAGQDAQALRGRTAGVDWRS